VILLSAMSTVTSSRTRARSAVSIALALAGTALVLACSKSEAAPPAGREDSNAPSQVAAGPKQESETFIATIAPPGECGAGKECTVEVTLEAKGVYKINDQYPTKWKAAEPAAEGVTYPKPLLKKEDGKWDDKKKGSFKVPFVAAKAGKVKVAGTLSLSVCSDANCIMEKAPLEIEVAVR
jgi:hypothetical protein